MPAKLVPKVGAGAGKILDDSGAAPKWDGSATLALGFCEFEVLRDKIVVLAIVYQFMVVSGISFQHSYLTWGPRPIPATTSATYWISS